MLPFTRHGGLTRPAPAARCSWRQDTSAPLTLPIHLTSDPEPPTSYPGWVRSGADHGDDATRPVALNRTSPGSATSHQNVLRPAALHPITLHPISLRPGAPTDARELLEALRPHLAGEQSRPAVLPLPPVHDDAPGMPRSQAPGTTSDATASAPTALAPSPGSPPQFTAEADLRMIAAAAVVVRTSGSTTGRGRLVALSAGALRASAEATHAALDGPGRWIGVLPSAYVAGLQVLVRSLVAGTEPVLVDTSTGFDPRALPEAIARARRGRAGGDLPTYLPLVPTMLHRALASGPEVVTALASVTRVLVGGARTPESLLARAADAGITVVRTYGASETAGGCVYDGHPLPGVDVEVDAGGRIRLGGPMIALGYLGDPAGTAAAFGSADGRRWWRTQDHGRIDSTGALHVLGRLDDVLVTGGVNVSAGAVESVLDRLPGIEEVVVTGVPDETWGTLVTAVCSGSELPLAQLREAVRRECDPAAAPRAALWLDALPRLSSGKPDRASIAGLAEAALADRRSRPGTAAQPDEGARSGDAPSAAPVVRVVHVHGSDRRPRR